MEQQKPTWTKIIAALLVLWGAMGLWAFYSQFTMSAESLAALPEAQQQVWKAMPGWLWVPYAIAVVAGFSGAVALLMGKAMAQPLFITSLAAMVVQFGYVFLVGPALSLIGPSAFAFPTLIIVVAAAQVWLSRNWRARGWLV